jgi:hypothetical protein
MIDKELNDNTKSLRYIWNLGGSFECLGTLYGMIIYYTLTIQLVLEFVRRNNENLCRLMLKTVWSCCSLRRSSSQTMFQTNQRDEARNRQILKMMAYFLTIFMTDVAIILTTILSTQGSEVNFGCYQAIGYSWLSLHVYCLFALFKVFLNGLKAANRLPRMNRNQTIRLEAHMVSSKEYLSATTLTGGNHPNSSFKGHDDPDLACQEQDEQQTSSFTRDARSSTDLTEVKILKSPTTFTTGLAKSPTRGNMNTPKRLSNLG